MGQVESTSDQHGATAETVGDKVLNAVTAPLAACCSTRAPARASVLLNSKKGELPVCNAAYKGDLHELQSLAHQGPGRKLHVGEKDADENTPLHWAAVRGHPKATDYLIQCDADVNYKNKDKDTPIHWACSGGNVEVIKLLLAAQADGLARNSDYTTPLHFAAADGHAQAVSLLLQAMRHRKHEAVNAANMDKDSPLHWVASEGHIAVVKILLEEGAEVNSVNKDLNTPLLVACAEGHVEVVKLLLSSGANVQMYNKDHWSAVHWACASGRQEVKQPMLKWLSPCICDTCVCVRVCIYTHTLSRTCVYEWSSIHKNPCTHT